METMDCFVTGSAAVAGGTTTQLLEGAYEVIDRKLGLNSNIILLTATSFLPRMAATPTSFLPALSPNDIDRAAQASRPPASLVAHS